MAKRKLENRKKTVVVAGDVVVDWFEVITPSPESESAEGQYRYNWQTYPCVRRFARPGGALLLAEFIRQATDAAVVSPAITDIQRLPNDRAIHAFGSIDSYPYSVMEQGRKVFRLKEWKGVSGAGSVKSFLTEGKTADADMIVIDDAGNGFRDDRQAWKNLPANKDAWIVLKMSRPLGEGELWNELQKRNGRLVLIVEADDLRMMDVSISRCLSWERTAQDFIWQMAYNRHIDFLHRPDYLIVRFGTEGVILCDNKTMGLGPILFFNPTVGEDKIGSVYPGRMVGTGSAFAAGFIAELMKEGREKNIEDGIRRGIASMERLWQTGFGEDAKQPDYQYKHVFLPEADKDFLIADTAIPAASPEEQEKQWRIMDELPVFLETIASNFVTTGRDEFLDRVPVGRFGGMTTLDRGEIESFNSIKNLVNEYLNSPRVKRPLCIGVFGPPGSGKSFGVTEVVKSIAPGRVPERPLEFNLSQFNSLEELTDAFHKIHDVALQNTVPLVFFDEFDSEFNGTKLGWLKYFLSPMQDGCFRDGECMHPLGKAIFVFAGGTRSTLAEFSGQETEDERMFRDAKGSDFVSRLRGYIDIKGPDPVDGDIKKDRLFMIRRAMVLRVLLQKHAPHIFRKGQICRVDGGIVRAFINVPQYKHGIRSMEAIIEMSSLSGRKSYEQSALPSPKQLQLHVDAETFRKIVVREAIFHSCREKIARAIHKQYLKDNKGQKPPEDIAMQSWETLPEDLRNSNFGQADDIIKKLRDIKCDFLPFASRKAEDFKLGPEEIEALAQSEHERFAEEKIRQGWIQGNKRDNDKKIRIDLVPWKELSEELKEFDRSAVKAIPELLKKAGLQIYRMR